MTSAHTAILFVAEHSKTVERVRDKELQIEAETKIEREAKRGGERGRGD